MLLDPARTVDQAARDVLEGLLRAPLRLGDPFAEPVRDAGDFAAQFLEGKGVAVVGGGQPLLDALGEAPHVALDLAAQLVEAGGGLGLDRLDPTVEIFGDAQDLKAHGLDRLGRPLLGRLDLLADRKNGPLDALIPAFKLSRVEATDHLGAAGFDRPTQGLGQFFEPGCLTGAFGLDPALGRAQPLVQPGEGAFQSTQGLGGAVLGLIKPLADLGEEV